MFQIDIQSNIDEWTEALEQRYMRQVPFATMLALNMTARDVRDHHKAVLPVIFDRPTRFTLNALMITPASLKEGRMNAEVWFKRTNRMRQHYLVPQVQGGGRDHKPFEYWLIRRGIMQPDEYAVPSRAIARDASGNIRPGVITSILSQLQAGSDSTQYETAKSKKRAGSKRVRYIVPVDGSNLRRGIWKVTGTKSYEIEPVLFFVKAPNYSKRYDFAGISRDKAITSFRQRFDEAMLRAISTARPTGPAVIDPPF